MNSNQTKSNDPLAGDMAFDDLFEEPTPPAEEQSAEAQPSSSDAAQAPLETSGDTTDGATDEESGAEIVDDIAPVEEDEAESAEESTVEEEVSEGDSSSEADPEATEEGEADPEATEEGEADPEATEEGVASTSDPVDREIPSPAAESPVKPPNESVAAAPPASFGSEEKAMFLEMLAGLNRQVEVLSSSMMSLAERVEASETRQVSEGRALPAASEEATRVETERQAAEAARVESEREVAESARVEAERQAAESARVENEPQSAEAAQSDAHAEAVRQEHAEAMRQAAEVSSREAEEASAREEAAREAAAREAAEVSAREEAARQAAEAAARSAAEASAREEAERQAHAEAERQAAEASSQEAAEEVAREEAARQARAEVERQAAEAAAREAAEASAREEAERQARAEAARQAAEAVAREAAEAAAREAAEAAAREAAEAAAREEAERQAAEALPAESDLEDEQSGFEPLTGDPFAEHTDEHQQDDEPQTDEGAFAMENESQDDAAFDEMDTTPSGGGPSLNLPADSPFADEEASASQRVSPSVSSAEGVNEYEPAYADLDEDTDMSVSLPTTASPLGEDMSMELDAPADKQVVAQESSGVRREPMDLLWAIAIVDPEAEASQREQQAAHKARSEAASAEASSRGKKQKVKLDPLPFDSLVAGTPLIATIFSPSGGVGKSSTAMNLAVYIAAIGDAVAKKRVGRGEKNVRVPRVLLLDGDVVQGSLALRLKGEVTPSMHTLMLYLDDRLESGFQGQDRWPSAYEDASPGEKAMRDFVMWPEVLPNLNLLAAPDEPDLFFDFGPKEYREILQMLSRFYDVIVIDAGTEVVMESNRAWLGHANEVFMITAPEIDRIYNASKASRYIATSRPHPQDDSPEPRKLPPLVTAEKLSVVMTRYDTDSGIDPETLMDESFPWLRDRPGQSFYVPDVQREMTKANNTGRFLVLENPAYAKVVGKLAKHMFNRYAAMRQKALPGG